MADNCEACQGRGRVLGHVEGEVPCPVCGPLSKLRIAPATVALMACSVCMYGIQGECHRRAPVAGGTSEHAYTFWPSVKPDDWCGEFASRADAVEVPEVERTEPEA